MVSAIIPFFNRELFLEEAIQSVFAQTHADWELLLVDDGSNDGSTGVARGYAERHPNRIFCLEHAGHRNLGPAASRNLGIRYARGEYIAFLDSDDVWMPHKLAWQTTLLKAHPDVVMTYGPCLIWHNWAGDRTKDLRDIPQDPGVSGSTIISPPKLLEMVIRSVDMLCSPSGILVHRRAALAVDGFAERFCGKKQMFEDHSFYAKLMLRENVLITDQLCFKYRQHRDSCVSVTHRAGMYDKRWIEFLRWLSNYLARTHAADTEIKAIVAKELRLLRVRYVARRVMPRFFRRWLRLLSSIAGFRARP
jgi:glycosyltransferase involved in cell wall biosynthesis